MKFYTWTVEIKVAAPWVADGFNLTDERAKDMVMEDLSWAREDEVRVKVLTAPGYTDIRKEQGFPVDQAVHNTGGNL